MRDSIKLKSYFPIWKYLKVTLLTFKSFVKYTKPTQSFKILHFSKSNLVFVKNLRLLINLILDCNPNPSVRISKQKSMKPSTDEPCGWRRAKASAMFCLLRNSAKTVALVRPHLRFWDTRRILLLIEIDWHTIRKHQTRDFNDAKNQKTSTFTQHWVTYP